MDRTDRATVSLISVVLALGALALGLAAVFIAGDSSAGGSSPAGGGTAAQQLELTLADLKITPAMWMARSAGLPSVVASSVSRYSACWVSANLARFGLR